jgi:hypothetical protein
MLGAACHELNASVLGPHDYWERGYRDSSLLHGIKVETS